MRKKYFKQTMLILMLLFYSFSQGQTLLHYWNFNNNASVSAITTPSQTSIAGASVTATISGISAIDFAGGTAQNFNVLNLNARNTDASGTHLRFNDAIGSALVFALPTTGYENAIVKFATRRSNTGAGTQVWSYSTDGSTYTFFSNIIPNNGDPGLATLDFSSISAADNNPNFKLKVEFIQGAGGTAGNNRFDNFTTEGTLIVSSDSTAPTATFFPINTATNVSLTTNPTISFNENVRLLNNDVITNTNVDAVVELRLNNASGTLVPFDATFSSNKITIVPSLTLTTNQLYYVALLPNKIEDESNNAISTLQSVGFTTTKPSVSLSVSSNIGTEVGTTSITVTATADIAVNGNQTIDLGVTGTNITAGDYLLNNSVITIANGQTTGSVTFTVVDDTLVEGSEVATLTISNPSAGIALGSTIAQSVTITDNDTALNIDLSTYVRVGRYNLPEPTRSSHPVNSLLAQEVSAVTYNWDTNTLFVVGDGSTSIVQISKTGELIDSMTLAQGSSPQGTEFYDTEGLTYIGNGQFVMTEERDRQVVKFTYVAGSTLTRAITQTVKLGTFVNNIGTEGISYDPLTNGYIALKEITPIGIFQTGIDFAAGTATNGSATTENSVNLFDPALLGVSDVADVFAMSNIPSLTGQSLYNNLLVLSQEAAKVVNIDRNGVVANTLTIASDPGNPLDVASQQHEGLTMDRDGILYITSENGGGDIDHPQLWVYAPSSLPNQAPTVVALTNTTNAILENSKTIAAVKVADISITDDGLGTNTLTLSGTDANYFQITGSSLYIKAGTVLDYETKTSYNLTINVDDATIGTTPDASVNYVLDVTDVLVETIQVVSVNVTEVASWSSSNTLVAADWFEVTNNGNSALDITGWKVDDSSNSFVSALALTGVSSIAAGESVIFLETSATNAATIIANFKSAWFGSNVPANLQVGYYTGSGIGLSSGGDALNLYDASGALMTNVTFGVATTNKTFNNALGLANTAISTLSQVGVNDAFAAINDTNQIGSPGSVGKLFISEVAPWSSSNSPVAADWFEVTNTKAVAVDITGWKMDDNSQSPAGAVALNGITSINPGESVIFMETNDLTAKTTAFLNNWFGTNSSSSLRIGNYTGSGVGLSSSGDQVNLYNATSVTPQSSVLFGASPTITFSTFDNSAGINGVTTPITQLSAVGTKGALIAANSSLEIGSPGTIITSPCPTIIVTATATVSTVCAGTTTTVSVSATGGTLPYVVSGSPLTVSGGTYNYTVTDAKGCTASTAVTITENPLADNVTTIAANNTYTWSVTGQTYTTSGIKTGTTTNCVTELLDLTITNTIITGPTTIASPYILPVASGVTTTSMLTVPETVGGYKMAGIPDGLGAFDNNDGTFTLLMNHELGNTLGATRAHGAIGSFVSKWIINKSNLSIASGSDLMTSLYGWNSTTQSLNTTTSTFAFNRFCSADLPLISAYYNPTSGLGTQDRIFMHGEEGGATGYQLATVASGADAGKAYILGKFNISTNGSGLTGVGAWENALANPFPQNKTIVIGNNDGGTGIMSNSVCVYQGTKTNSGTAVDKAGLTNGTLKFVNVIGSTLEIPTANATSRATNITSGTAFTLNATTSTTFSRPEDGAWDPTDTSKYYFVTTDRLDTAIDGIGTQIGRSRLWRLNFTDITNPDLGGTIDLLLDGTEGQVMMDNMSFDKYGHILLLEDVGGAAHNGKVWQYTIATDQLKMLAKHDPAKFGDIVNGVTQTATLPFNNDEETSGIIDMSDILGAGNFLFVDQAHYTSTDSEAVEGGQLLKLYNPDTFIASQCATTSSETQSACNSYVWNGKTYTNSGMYTNTSTNVAGCFHTTTLNLTIVPSSLISQPTNPTICKSAAAIASTKVVAANGSTYKWYTQTATGSTWTALVNNANYSGIDEAELKITRTTTSIPATGTKYRVVVSNICGNINSDTVVLQELTVVSRAAVITVVGTLSPTLTTCQGNSVNLSLAAGSIGNIQWQSSTDGNTYSNIGDLIVQSALSATNIAMPFNTGTLTQSSWFRVVASNGVCNSVNGTSIKITVSTPVTTGSISGGDITVCAPLATGLDANGTALTTAITNSTLLTLSDYTVGATILWQKSTNYVNSIDAAVVWAAAGSTTNTLTANPLTVDTWYRALVTNGACKDFTLPVKITVTKPAKAGIITSAASVCIGGDIMFTSAAYTGTSIQWEVSTTSASTGFTPIADANQLTFTMNAVSYAPLSKFYVRNVVTSGNCTLARSAVKTITVNPISVSGTVKGGGTICEGSNATLSVAGYTGTIQWEYSFDGVEFKTVPYWKTVATVPTFFNPDNATTFSTTASTGTAATYIASNITANTYFRAKITSGACSVAYSNSVQYTIGTAAVSGIITAANATVCSGTGTTLTLANAIGTIKWLKSTNWTAATPNWTAVTTSTTGTLATGNLTVATAYKADVTIGSCSTETSLVVPVYVYAAPLAKTITANVTLPSGASSTLAICNTSTSKVLTIGVGSIGAIQWQRSTTSTTLGFADIVDATVTSYTISNPTVGANYFRAKFTNSCGVSVYGTAFTVYYKDCVLVKTASTKVVTKVPFEVLAYPNPSFNNFNLALTTSSSEKVEVIVYDAMGRLINKMEVSPTEVSEMKIGDNYPSGVYNLIVSQGTAVKTLRVIKQ